MCPTPCYHRKNHAGPHDYYFSITTIEEASRRQSLIYPSRDARRHASGHVPFQRKVESGPSLPASREPPSRFSTSLDYLVSPPTSPSLKRRSHIRRKGLPWRPSTDAPKSKRWSEPCIKSLSSPQYACSRQNPAPLYISPPSTPIQINLRSETPEPTSPALPDSHGPPLLLAGSYNPPSSEPIHTDVPQETEERRDLALPESDTRSPSTYVASDDPRLPPLILTQQPKESWDTIPDSPSVYSIVTASEVGSFHDTTGDINSDSSIFTWDTESFHWDLDTTEYPWPNNSEGRIDITLEADSSLESENDRPWLKRQSTTVIVELLRERRRRTGID